MRALVALALLATVLLTVRQPTNVDVARHRWECVACVLSHLGMQDPFAWGTVSLVQGAPAAFARPAFVPIALWLTRSLADGYFVPVNECRPLLFSALGEFTPALDDAVACSRGATYFALLLSDRFRIAMVVDELVAAAAAVSVVPALNSAGGMPFRILKLLVTLCDPGDGLTAYFINTQLNFVCEASTACAVLKASGDGSATEGEERIGQPRAWWRLLPWRRRRAARVSGGTQAKAGLAGADGGRGRGVPLCGRRSWSRLLQTRGRGWREASCSA